MIHGIMNIRKEADFTSHDVVAKLRGILKQKKIGHTGTLDPEATGVLPICLGRGTKLCDMLTDSNKEYKVTFRLGIETDTEDIWGNVLKETPVDLDCGICMKTIISFCGDYEQIPPMYSARKVDGKKLYELAREGKVIERKPKKVRILAIYDLDIQLPDISMTVLCSKGTYIRSLCRDIGFKLGTGATMTSLERTCTSGFDIKDSITLSQVEEAVKNGTIDQYIIPVDDMFQDEPKATAKKEFYKLLYNGNPLKEEHLKESNINKRKRLRIYDEEEHFIGIYEWKDGKKMFFPEKIFYEMN